jgi:hypothetical protein
MGFKRNYGFIRISPNAGIENDRKPTASAADHAAAA